MSILLDLIDSAFFILAIGRLDRGCQVQSALKCHLIFNDVYFEIASMIQLEILRRLANFTFHENYLSSQSTFGQSYM